MLRRVRLLAARPAPTRPALGLGTLVAVRPRVLRLMLRYTVDLDQWPARIWWMSTAVSRSKRRTGGGRRPAMSKWAMSPGGQWAIAYERATRAAARWTVCVSTGTLLEGERTPARPGRLSTRSPAVRSDMTPTAARTDDRPKRRARPTGARSRLLIGASCPGGPLRSFASAAWESVHSTTGSWSCARWSRRCVRAARRATISAR